MQVQVNRVWREFPDGITVLEILEKSGIAEPGIAVALDGEVVRRGQWSEVVVPKGSTVDILTAVQGG
jgi:sulfur carrier protein